MASPAPSARSASSPASPRSPRPIAPRPRSTSSAARCRTAAAPSTSRTTPPSRFDISVSDDQTVEALDQQVNLTLDGDITIGETVLPLVIELRYFRIGNHGGTVSVSLLNAPDQTAEVDRLVELGVDRFVAATG